MKRKHFIFAVITSTALSFLGLTSCSSLEQESAATHRVTFTAEFVQSKTSVNEQEDAAHFLWDSSDAGRFHVFENGKAALSTEVRFNSDMSSAQVSAEFSDTGASSFEYSCFVSGYDTPCVPALQYSRAQGYDPDAELLIAEPVITSRTGNPIAFKFQRPATVNKMTIKGLTPGEKVSKVRITSKEASLAGIYSISSGSFSESQSSLDIRFTDLSTDSDGSATVYFISRAVNEGTFLTINVTTDKGAYEKEFSRQICFPEGMMTRFSVTVMPEEEYDARTIAELKALISSSTESTFNTKMEGVVVTVVNGNNAYIQDGTAGIYVYGCASSLNVGECYSGKMSFSGKVYNRQKEVTQFDFSAADKTTGVEAEAVELSLDQLCADLDGEQEYEAMRVVVRNVTPAANLSGTRISGTLNQGSSSLAIYTYATISMDNAQAYDVYGYPLKYRGTTRQIIVMDSSDVVLHDDSDSPDTPDPDQPDTPDPDEPDTPNPDQPGEGAVFGKTGWMELPAYSTANSSYFYGTFYGTSTNAVSGSGKDRNYTYLYDKSMYTSYWVAYPLYSSTFGGSRSGSWKSNPAISEDDQVNCWSSSYNVAYGSTMWSSNATSAGDYYARGHQIPDGDRSNHSTMQSQTYFATNSTPQIQNKFNGGVWMQLESAVRSMASATDTLYVVTGASFRKVGGSESITYIYPKGDENKATPVPNYYWKVLLKVKRSGSQVTSASAIGFWFEHKQISGSDWQSHAVSVATIQQYTGFDFFVNVPGDNGSGVENAAEANSDLTAFENF